MTRKPSGLRRCLKWVGAGLFALLSLVYLNSLQFATGYQGSFIVAFNEGCLDICPRSTRHEFTLAYPTRVTNVALPRFFDHTRLSIGVEFWPRVFQNFFGTFYRIPLWFVMLPLAAGTAVLWYRDRHPPPGRCQRCGYDLTGNVSGKCPECGAPT